MKRIVFIGWFTNESNSRLNCSKLRNLNLEDYWRLRFNSLIGKEINKSLNLYFFCEKTLLEYFSYPKNNLREGENNQRN